MKLLLAEDERDLSRALVAILKHNNYTVDPVYDAFIPVEYIYGNDFYIADCICDNRLPEVVEPRIVGCLLQKQGAVVEVLA